ncbi:hypothetical protein CRM22_003780, partial [Opisthorchis felineus]
VHLGGTPLCVKDCELSFELGLARTYLPHTSQDAVLSEWAYVHYDSVNNALHLQEGVDYSSLHIMIDKTVYIWKTENHIQH